MERIPIAFCLVAVSLLAGSPALAACPNGYSAYGHSCVPNAGTPSSPSGESLNTKPAKPIKSRRVPSTPSGEQVCPKGYKGTPPNCATVQDGKKVIFF